MNNKITAGVELIRLERERQIDEEGFSIEKDYRFEDSDDLSLAGAIYALPFWFRENRDDGIPKLWPWMPEYYKPCPKDRVRELVKAGALIAAEIDRYLYEQQFKNEKQHDES